VLILRWKWLCSNDPRIAKEDQEITIDQDLVVDTCCDSIVDQKIETYEDNDDVDTDEVVTLVSSTINDVNDERYSIKRENLNAMNKQQKNSVVQDVMLHLDTNSIKYDTDLIKYDKTEIEFIVG
jgi:hypothetical protein